MKGGMLYSHIFLITKAHSEKLNAIAKRLGISRSAAIRKLIEDAYARKEASRG